MHTWFKYSVSRLDTAALKYSNVITCILTVDLIQMLKYYKAVICLCVVWILSHVFTLSSADIVKSVG